MKQGAWRNERKFGEDGYSADWVRFHAFQRRVREWINTSSGM